MSFYTDGQDSIISGKKKGSSPFPFFTFPQMSVEKPHSICGDLCLVTVGVAETVREMLEIMFPVRARSDRERRKGIAGDEAGRG